MQKKIGEEFDADAAFDVAVNANVAVPLQRALPLLHIPCAYIPRRPEDPEMECGHCQLAHFSRYLKIGKTNTSMGSYDGDLNMANVRPGVFQYHHFTTF